MPDPGEPKKKKIGKDPDIAELLYDGQPENVEKAIALMHERYGPLIWYILRDRNPELSQRALQEIYEAGFHELKCYALEGHFANRNTGTGALALLKRIVIFDAIDCYRRQQRHEKYLRHIAKVRVDDPRQLDELVIAIREFIEAKLEGLEQIALKVYLELLSRWDGKDSDTSPLLNLADEVRKARDDPSLTDDDIWSAFDSAAKKLGKYLKDEGFLP